MLRAVLLAALLAQATSFSVMNMIRIPGALSSRHQKYIESNRPSRESLSLATTMQEVESAETQLPKPDWMRKTGRKTVVTLRSAAGTAAGELEELGAGFMDGLEGSVEGSSHVLQQLGDILRRSSDSGVVAAAAAAFAMLVLNPALPGATMQALGTFWDSYNGALAAGGVTTVAVKSLTCSGVMGAGDVLCQKMFPKEEVIDGHDAFGRAVPPSTKKSKGKIQLRGVGNFGLVGLLIAPIVHQWYSFLGTVSVGGLLGGVQQVCLDQMFFAPAMIALVFSMLQGLEGKGPAEMKAKLQSDWKTAVLNNWKLWIPAQLINFIFVPAPLQVLFSNVIGLGWNVYLSKLNSKN